MRKTLLLLLSVSVLFIIGCGSGGGGGTTASVSANSPEGGNLAALTLNLRDGGATAVAASSDFKHALAITSGTANNARVVIRKFQSVTTQVPYWTEFDSDGFPVGDPVGYNTVTSYTEIYRRVVDAPVIAGAVTVNAPVSQDSTDTYIFDVLTFYASANQPNEMLKFGHTEGVVVQSGLSLTITINDICADPSVSLTDPSKVGSVFVQLPTNIISEQSYKVTADARTPVRKYYEMGVALSTSGAGANIRNTYVLSSNPVIFSKTTNLLTAPTTTNLSDTQLMFTIKYFISDDMLDKTKNESFLNWERIYPGDYGTTGESLKTTFIPLTGVTIPTP